MAKVISGNFGRKKKEEKGSSRRVDEAQPEGREEYNTFDLFGGMRSKISIAGILLATSVGGKLVEIYERNPELRNEKL